MNYELGRTVLYYVNRWNAEREEPCIINNGLTRVHHVVTTVYRDNFSTDKFTHIPFTCDRWYWSSPLTLVCVVKFFVTHFIPTLITHLCRCAVPHFLQWEKTYFYVCMRYKYIPSCFLYALCTFVYWYWYIAFFTQFHTSIC